MGLGMETTEVKRHSHGHLSRVRTISMPFPADVYLARLAEAVFITFLRCKISLLSPFHAVRFVCVRFFFFFKILFILSLDRREGKEKEGEKHQCVVAFHMPSTGDLVCNPGMCPDWESNWLPKFRRLVLNPLSHTSQGCTHKAQCVFSV